MNKKQITNSNTKLIIIVLIILITGTSVLAAISLVRNTEKVPLSFAKQEALDDAGLKRGVHARMQDGLLEISVVSDRGESTLDQRIDIKDVTLKTEKGYSIIDVTARYYATDVATGRRMVNPRSVINIQDKLKSGTYVVRLKLFETSPPLKPEPTKPGELFTTALTLP